MSLLKTPILFDVPLTRCPFCGYECTEDEALCDDTAPLPYFRFMGKPLYAFLCVCVMTTKCGMWYVVRKSDNPPDERQEREQTS
jgi:hypothetical protein